MKNEYDGTSAEWNKDTPQPASGEVHSHSTMNWFAFHGGVLVAAVTSLALEPPLLPIVAILVSIWAFATIEVPGAQPYKLMMAACAAMGALTGVFLALLFVRWPFYMLCAASLFFIATTLINARKNNTDKREI